MLEKCGKVKHDAATPKPAVGPWLCKEALSILALHSCGPSPDFSQRALALFTSWSSEWGGAVSSVSPGYISCLLQRLWFLAVMCQGLSVIPLATLDVKELIKAISLLALRLIKQTHLTSELRSCWVTCKWARTLWTARTAALLSWLWTFTFPFLGRGGRTFRKTQI